VSSPNKRKRGGTRASAAPSAERILGHLDRLRHLGTKGLYKTDPMQKALGQAQSVCTDSQKSQYSNLFALLEVEETTGGGGGRGKGAPRGRRPAATSANNPANKKSAKPMIFIKDSSEESTEVSLYLTI
jgi:hypothetical protein